MYLDSVLATCSRLLDVSQLDTNQATFRFLCFKKSVWSIPFSPVLDLKYRSIREE